MFSLAAGSRLIAASTTGSACGRAGCHRPVVGDFGKNNGSAACPAGSPIIPEALSVTGRGRELFELLCSNDLEGIVAKRLSHPYDPRVRSLKIKNATIRRSRGRADLFNARRERPAHPAGWR
jgi:hypothetical protein